MKVINLCSGPGAGKSTLAAGLFYEMKSRGLKVELVTEYAKELTYEGDWETLKNQHKVTREQFHRQRRLMGQVDFCVTDSPLFFGSIYYRGDDLLKFHEGTMRTFRWFDNETYFVTRAHPYQPWGRRQSEDSAKRVDTQIIDLLDREGIPYGLVPGDSSAVFLIMADLKQKGIIHW